MTRHILNTGQTFCALSDGTRVDCADTGQDAEFRTGEPWPEPRFSTEGELVRDELTGLTWTANANPFDFPLTHAEALEKIQELNSNEHLGKNCWRLPNRRELRSLISHDEKKPALPSGHPFRNVMLGWYWTSTESAIQPGYHWYVHLEGGRMFYGRHDNYCLAWPVCGKSAVLPATGAQEPETGVPLPEPRFSVQDETAQDTLTGLTWKKDADAAEKTTSWADAFATVHELNARKFGGYDDWRLPTINELESIVDAGHHTPALAKGHPFDKTRDAYWSSTNSAFESDWAMCLYLSKGAVGVGWKEDSESFHVWPVRGL